MITGKPTSHLLELSNVIHSISIYCPFQSETMSFLQGSEAKKKKMNNYILVIATIVDALLEDLTRFSKSSFRSPGKTTWER